MRRIQAAAFTRRVAATIDEITGTGEIVILTRRGTDLVAIVPLTVRLSDEEVAGMVAKARAGSSTGAPTFYDVRGIARTTPGDPPSEDIVRQDRDEWEGE